MNCPICGLSTAPNAIDDARCGRCFNWGVLAIYPGSVLVKVPRKEWLKDTRLKLRAAGNLDPAYEQWLAALESRGYSQ